MNVYSLFNLQEDWIGVGHCIDGTATFQLLYQKAFVPNWKVLLFDVRDGKLVDFQPNDLGFALCSHKMRSAIDESLIGGEAIQWLPAFVTGQPAGITVEYSILHVYRKEDVLNGKRSIFSDDHLVKPVLDSQKVQRLKANIFATPSDSVRIYILESVKRHLTDRGITGIKFLKAAIA